MNLLSPHPNPLPARGEREARRESGARVSGNFETRVADARTREEK
jgi:hypothetical protein